MYFKEYCHACVINILLLNQICDLGSARSLDHTTRHTTAVGTYAWMAPEVRQCHVNVCSYPASDMCPCYQQYQYRRQLSIISVCVSVHVL